MKKNRTTRIRFAPSPTGSPHIGSVWQVLLEWLACKSKDGTFILRIEDTDRTRFVEGAEKEIFDALKWLGITVDEGPEIGGEFGPYRQSERLDIYRKYADELINNNTAYFCFCSSERLAELRAEQEKNKQPTRYDRRCLSLDREDIEKRLYRNEPFVIRMKVPNSGETKFTDIIRGEIAFLNDTIDDQVLIKSDGWPTYHLASVVDDHLMQITDVIRGEEWLSSTPKHLILYNAFGWQAPTFAHLPLILGADKSKLSKRHGSTHLSQFVAAGYLPEAMINYLALLGWNPKTEEEIFSLDELIKRFDLKDVNKKGAIFDTDKLNWFNAYYIKQLSLEELAKRLQQYVDVNKYDKDMYGRALEIIRERLVKLEDAEQLLHEMFELPDYEADLLIWKKGSREEALDRLNKISAMINSLPLNDINAMEDDVKKFIDENNLGVGNTLWPLRVALSGSKNSPSPFELLYVLGLNESEERIKKAIDKLS